MRADKKLRILIVFGTRPEAIKLAPVVREAAQRPWAQPIVCVTAQHREMLDQMLEVFGIKPEIDLSIMTHKQSLPAITAKILTRLSKVIVETRPRLVVTQGDTTTTFAASLAAFYEKVPVAHVEAGLRTWKKDEPFPEESNRKLADALADFHFAATEGNRENLLTEGADPEKIFVVGNTVVDALRHILRANRGRAPFDGLPAIDRRKKLIVVTAHRRESFGEPLRNICEALKRIVDINSDVEIVYPVHLNPNVLLPVRELVGGNKRIHLLPPLDYCAFVELLRRTYLILTDSGGVQEEAPSLKKPVIVMRDVTERPEGVDAGFVRVVGTGVGAIVDAAQELLGDSSVHERLKRIPNPYGDGHSASRILSIIGRHRASLLSRH
ncbi:MAG: UDP-N-acetylglucosamine 2-epimerase (non-hydrolyzing) [Candidatus Lindowbacteria bacterium]|nr:UDP-N-acetylglucosamine 2-epimerase (non-hydrolyzing) [Candidatus Lindowbacteria bacterium]